MEEQNQQATGSAQEETASSGATPGADPQSQALIDELNRLGAKFADAADAAWRSEQRKQLEEDLRSGIVSVAQSIERHLKEFSRREDTQQVLNKAEHVAEKVRSSKVSQEIAAALTQGLRALSEQLEKLANDLRERDAARAAGAPEEQASTPAEDESSGQDIPIRSS